MVFGQIPGFFLVGTNNPFLFIALLYFIVFFDINEKT